MNEEEVRIAKETLEALFSDSTGEDYPYTEKFGQAVNIGIQALEELEQYRALGTVEELKEAKKLLEKLEELKFENEQPKTDWIPCEVEMPKEHDSMFAKLKGTDKWSSGMFEKISDEVNVTIELQDGSRITRTSNTIDGKWEVETNPWLKQKVIAWQPLPQPYKKEGAENDR